MKNKYQNIAVLRLEHSYFDSNKSVDLRLSPTTETAIILKQYGFLIRPKLDGFTLFYNGVSDLSTLFRYITSKQMIHEFQFVLTSNSYDFYNYTEFPTNWMGKVYFSSSHQITNSDSDELVLKPIYKAEDNPNEIGIVSLVFSDLIAKEASEYTIRFAARKTQWNYYVINRSEIELHDPIIGTKNTIVFNLPVKVNLPTGESALCFSSGETLLRLSESPYQNLSLVDQLPKISPTASAKLKTIVANLPFPLANRMAQSENPEHQFFISPMYIYL